MRKVRRCKITILRKNYFPFRSSSCRVVGLTLLVFTIFACNIGVHASPRIGVVLGGGAARGFSHIGLLQALEENGVPIDLLVGTSMGSIIASLYAAGYSVNNMRQIATQLDIAELVDPIIPPKGGLITSSRLQFYLDTLLQHKTFAELDIPFYSVITNVKTGEEIALHDGLVSVGVQASMSIPGLFPPVPIEGQYYVDGGMKNAVPANVAKQQGADVIIAVNVKKEAESINHDSLMTNLELVLWFMIEGYAQMNISAADVVIIPDVKHDSYMDFQKVGSFIERGYLAGLAQMDEIKAAVLAHDPTFQFIPYAQAGFTDLELASTTRLAISGASRLPRPLQIIPELTLDTLDQLPQIGVRISHGFLGPYSIGYRYGLHRLEGSQEIFWAWSNPDGLKAEFFARTQTAQDTPALGGKVSARAAKDLNVTALYLNKGKVHWRLSSARTGLATSQYAKFDLMAHLTKQRTAAPYEITVNPAMRIFPFAPKASLQTALIQPYGYVGLRFTTPSDTLKTTASYELGVGSECRFFGLYPVETRVVCELKPDAAPQWMVKIQTVEF